MSTDLAPRAKKIAHNLEKHGDLRIDDYYWLNDRENPDVIDYLNKENDYTKALMQHTEVFQDKLFNEIKGRIKEDDSSVPYQRDGDWFYTRYEKGSEYEIYCRRKNSMDEPEEVLLNVNDLAEKHSFYAVSGLSLSSNKNTLAFGEDKLGRRIYTVRFKVLDSGAFLEDELQNTTGSVAWANDNKTVFYTVKDPTTLRSHKIYKHVLGTSQDEDELVFHEEDDTFSCVVYKSKSRDYIFIGSWATVSSEYRFIPADQPNTEFQILEPRQRDHEYSVAHYKEHFYILTNWEAQNFRLMKTPVNASTKENWEEVLAHRSEVLLEDIEIFNDYLVLGERKNGLTHIRILPWDNAVDEHYIAFDEETYVAYTSTNVEFETDTLRFVYSSLTVPDSVYDYNMKTRERELKKQQEVVGGYNAEEYHAERHYATAQDGTKVPISLVYKKACFEQNGENPLLLYAYGSYGHSTDPGFSSVRLSLLDRGFVYAIAHIRGGEEMGRAWYENGKLLKKKNTFTDFIDCAQYLVDKSYTSPQHLYAMGGSAGGLLMGAVINIAPKLFNGVVAAVPFVDVVTTMLDDSIPLTTGEYDEWGNPNNEEYYHYIKSYSPYDNIEAKDYPNLLVTTGLHDSQVQYWEPAKWVAKLREMKTDQNKLFLHTNMSAGHGGSSGRFERIKEIALEYAFLFDLEGINK
tara:strand:- start:56 stop:2113 length:2058 start_codon:yes stop_codon:yes gene_type:complete